MPRDDDWPGRLAESAAGSEAREAAAAELHRLLRAALARGFGRQLGDADLDDLAQEAVTKVLARMSEFRGESRFSTWATAIAVNGALGELRKRRTRGTSTIDAVEAGAAALRVAPSGPDDLRQAELARGLRRAIDEALTDNQREALLAELGGLPLMEVARRTGRKRGAVYKLLHDARKRLRTHLEGQGFDVRDLAPDAEEGVA